jgi:membrane AbrB-like protein
MTGAMLGTAALAWHRPVGMPGWARPAGLVFLGLGLGTTFSGPVLATATAALPVMLLGGVLAILSGPVVARLFTRLAGTDQQTGFFCAAPGGIIVPAILAQEAKASVATVTMAQTMRVLMVVLTLPPLLGWLAPHGDFSELTAARIAVWWPGLLAMAATGLALAFPLRKLGLANPWMLGPCALAIGLAATGHLPSSVPTPLVDAAQVAMGATLGTRLTRGFLISSRRLALAFVLSALVLSLLLTALAVVVALASGLPVAAMILGLARGDAGDGADSEDARARGAPDLRLPPRHRPAEQGQAQLRRAPAQSRAHLPADAPLLNASSAPHRQAADPRLRGHHRRPCLQSALGLRWPRDPLLERRGRPRRLRHRYP